MKKIIFLIISILIFLLCGCSKLSESSLEIYVIEQTKLNSSLNDRETVKLIKQNGRLAFNGEDINGYNWETHTISLKNEAVPSHSTITSESGGSAIFKVDDSYAYAIVLNDALVYVGGFMHGSKNPSIPLQPSINDIDEYSFKITFDSKYATGADPRDNKSFYKFLSKFGKLSSGAI